ncbi:MAG TPA: radical SAM protein, partial [Flavobacteriales bacterium]|nr:radical SAM protein [Flavobacteriales bacterium]
MENSTVLNKISAQEQLSILSEVKKDAFVQKLNEYGSLPLKADNPEILQINLGKMCNQTCTHCHVDAGPTRTEIMSQDVLQQCLHIIENNPSIHTVDLTGGAPEMNPHFRWFIQEVRSLKPELEIIVRSNLTILTSSKYKDYPQFFKENKITVVSSLPCYTKENVDKQRGNGVFDRSIKALLKLNEAGYGKDETLQLHLVYNPGGPSIAPAQEALQNDYKKRLKEDFGIEFNQLFTITNLPISRFLEFLLSQNSLEEYMDKLIENFNPQTLTGVMCKNTVSVGWDGTLYDCDFNQMLELPIKNKIVAQTVFDFDSEKLSG